MTGKKKMKTDQIIIDYVGENVGKIFLTDVDVVNDVGGTLELTPGVSIRLACSADLVKSVQDGVLKFFTRSDGPWGMPPLTVYWLVRFS